MARIGDEKGLERGECPDAPVRDEASQCACIGRMAFRDLLLTDS